MVYGAYRLMGDPKNFMDNICNMFIPIIQKRISLSFSPQAFEIILCQMVGSLANIVFESTWKEVALA